MGCPGFQAGLTHPLIWPSPSLKVDDNVDPRKDKRSLEDKNPSHSLSLWIYYSLHLINKGNPITETDSWRQGISEAVKFAPPCFTDKENQPLWAGVTCPRAPR